MQKPTDYPVKSKPSKRAADLPIGDITYAVLRERVDAKKPITNEMIRVAQTKLAIAQGNKASASNSSSRFKMPKLRGRAK